LGETAINTISSIVSGSSALKSGSGAGSLQEREPIAGEKTSHSFEEFGFSLLAAIAGVPKEHARYKREELPTLTAFAALPLVDGDGISSSERAAEPSGRIADGSDSPPEFRRQVEVFEGSPSSARDGGIVT
jgi:hypothetical protein